MRRVHREGLDGIGDGNEAWRTVERRKRPCVRPATFETGSCSSGGVWGTAKRDSMGYCSSPPSTSSSLHGLPSTSSSLHGLLFIQPSTPRGPVQPPLHGHPSTIYCSSCPPHHGVLFIHPSTGTPPPSNVHPALHHTMGSCSSRGNATAHCSSKPPRNTHCSFQRQHRSTSVSSSSEGIARSGLVNSHRLIARVP